MPHYEGREETERELLAQKIEHGFQIEKEGQLYDIGIAEGGENVCAWRAGTDEGERAAKTFGTTDPWTGKPEPETVAAVIEWLTP